MFGLFCFLLVIFEGFGYVVVDYKVYIWFVDFYFKCDCGDDDLDFVLDECVLVVLVVGVFYVCVVGGGVIVLINEFFVNGFCIFLWDVVDDFGFVGVVVNDMMNLFKLVWVLMNVIG